MSWYDYAEQLGEENEPKKYVVFLDQMMQTLPGCVKRVLDKTDLDAVLKSMLTHRIVSLMLKVCREEAKVQANTTGRGVSCSIFRSHSRSGWRKRPGCN